jgi:hypothetical protein
MSFDTARDGDGWKARCQNCHAEGRADRLAELGGWMAAHKCPPTPRQGAKT